MREIKFRFFDTNVKSLEYFKLDGEFDCISGWLDNGILMQYTGLKDKIGKEIYEGDIMDYGFGRVFSVQFKEGGYVAVFPDLKSNSMIPLRLFEIIGNIYENPELLK